MINQISRDKFVAAIEAGIAAAGLSDAEAVELRRFGATATCSAWLAFQANGYDCPLAATGTHLSSHRREFTGAFDRAILRALPLDYTFNNLVEVTDA